MALQFAFRASCRKSLCPEQRNEKSKLEQSHYSFLSRFLWGGNREAAIPYVTHDILPVGAREARLPIPITMDTGPL